MNYSIKFAYQGKLKVGTLLPEINFDSFNEILIGSRSIELLVERAIKVLLFLDNDQKENVIGQMLSSWN